MKIIKARVKNFGPYGNNWTELNFTDIKNSFSLIVGGNGNGKSYLMDIFSFAIYGKISNKKLKDIPNRLNENCESYIELDINNHILTIERGIAPSYFKVSIDGDYDIGDRAGKLNVQDYLEEEWFKIPYHLFNNIISLSINDFKSFIKMSNKDKTDIIDKIFGLAIINEMYGYLKNDVKEIKEQNRELTTKTIVLSEQIDITTQELENLSELIINDTTSKKETIEKNIGKLKLLKVSISQELSELNDILNERNYSIKEIQKKINANSLNISKFDDKIEFFKQDRCPECGSSLKDDEHANILNDYLKSKETIVMLNKELQKEIEVENSERSIIRDKQDDVKNKLQKIELKNDNLIKELKNLNRSDNLDKQTLSMTKLVDDSKIKLEIALKDKTKIDNKQKFYKIIDDLLGEKGIKQLAINTIIPGINSQIQNLLKELGLVFNLEFDSEFDTKITHLGKEISHSTLSTGENKKLDFAIIIAIIKIMKTKYPGLNLLFLDELLGNLDNNSVVHVLNILNKLSKEYDMHIFVVHHALLDNNLFDRIILVDKINEFSNITIQKQ